MDLEALKAQFAARGGAVTRVETGVRAIESDSAIYRAMREGGRVAADGVQMARASESDWERQQDAFRSAKYDGWTDAAALDYAQQAS
jgi:hypothetical protein